MSNNLKNKKSKRKHKHRKASRRLKRSKHVLLNNVQYRCGKHGFPVVKNLIMTLKCPCSVPVALPMAGLSICISQLISLKLKSRIPSVNENNLTSMCGSGCMSLALLRSLVVGFVVGNDDISMGTMVCQTWFSCLCM